MSHEHERAEWLREGVTVFLHGRTKRGNEYLRSDVVTAVTGRDIILASGKRYQLKMVTAGHHGKPLPPDQWTYSYPRGHTPRTYGKVGDGAELLGPNHPKIPYIQRRIAEPAEKTNDGDDGIDPAIPRFSS